jgi:uncharacterized protein YecE (DUF72 family)
VGCCGFPAARAKYYGHFAAVEVQQTFYQPPRISTAERWRAEAPEGFTFTLKAWQLITHLPTSPTYRRLSKPIPTDHWHLYGAFRPTEEVHEAWLVTRRIAEALETPVVLFQCPASFRPAPRNLRDFSTFFESIERGKARLAWEPRGAWPRDLVSDLCRDLRLIHCVDPFAETTVTGDPFYYRMHGIGGFSYQYRDDDLCRLFDTCRGRDGYVFFNNATMWYDALRFRALSRR